MKDYYQVLGIRRSASADEIKRAYRRLAVKYHPDKNPDAGADAIIKEINEAYDTLSDPEKKLAYDWKLSVAYAATPNDETLRHKDRRYRRKRPPQYPPFQPRPRTYDLMKEYLPYLIKVCWPGLFITIFLAVDFFLPYRISKEKITDIYSVHVRSGIGHFVIRTESNREIAIYDDLGDLTQDRSIVVEETRLYGTEMKVSNASGEYQLKLGTIYRTLVFSPVILFLASAGAIVFRKRIEFSFNLCVVSAIFLIINLFLIF